MITHNILLSLLIGILFLLLSHPLTYQMTDKLLHSIRIRTSFDNVMGLPTVSGLLIHATVFTFLVFVVIQVKQTNMLPVSNRMIIDKPIESRVIE